MTVTEPLPQEVADDRPPWSCLCGPRREDTLLFAVTRQEFFDRHKAWADAIISASDIDWQYVCHTAIAHGVAPLTWRNLQQCGCLTIEVRNLVAGSLDAFTRKNLLFKDLASERISRVLTYFSERSVACLLVKGAALDRVVYKQPWFTTSADVDLVIGCVPDDLPIRDRVEANQLLAGTNPLDRIVTIESEWQQHHDVTLNGLLPIDFRKVWKSATSVDYHGAQAFVMCHEDLLLCACTNAWRKRYFRLKSLLDVAETVCNLPIDWDWLSARAKQWQCGVIVYAALAAAQCTIGCRTPTDLSQRLGVSRARRRVVESLVRRMSFRSLATLYEGRRLGGKRIGKGLILPYATLGWRQFSRSVLRRGALGH